MKKIVDLPDNGRWLNETEFAHSLYEGVPPNRGEYIRAGDILYFVVKAEYIPRSGEQILTVRRHSSWDEELSYQRGYTDALMHLANAISGELDEIHIGAV